ncbi:MAG: DNA polymerase III subunit delta' [Bifidobacteriaceae bacterium]|nr:DNA polymerase III subunit delta' [Bifidobacteriaceae bacterium]
MSVWDEAVGQDQAVAQLVDAAARPEAMTHAWLITGPPGSGRSVVARAFAAALQCSAGGCGTCDQCRAVEHRSHPDVLDGGTQKLVIGIDDVREWVTLAARTPAMGRWRVIVVEDADRMLERTGNVLLKSLEEPPPHTVWILTAPSPFDVLVTVRSRCRHVALRIPPVEAVTKLLVERDGVEPEAAHLAALEAQCHIGVARLLAKDPEAQARRRSVLAIPRAASSVAQAVIAAGELDVVAREQADAVVKVREDRERAELVEQLGEAPRGRMSTFARQRLKEYDEESGKRAKRTQVDTLDLALVDLLAFYRDVLAVQLGASVELINARHTDWVVDCARSSSPPVTLLRLEAVERAREHLAGNVAPALALEAMAVALALPQLSQTVPSSPNQPRQGAAT